MISDEFLQDSTQGSRQLNESFGVATTKSDSGQASLSGVQTSVNLLDFDESEVLSEERDTKEEQDKGDINFGSVHPNQSTKGGKANLRRMQSVMDPDKVQQLYNYNLDAFKNSVWENFLGSHV